MRKIIYFLKTILKYIGRYVLSVVFGLLLILLLWVVTRLPDPYPALIGCVILGLIIGFGLGLNAKNK